jgi:hypothetical protein
MWEAVRCPTTEFSNELLYGTSAHLALAEEGSKGNGDQ